MSDNPKVPVVAWRYAYSHDQQGWQDWRMAEHKPEGANSPMFRKEALVRQADHLADRAEWEQAAAVEAKMADDLRVQLSAAQAEIERLRAIINDLPILEYETEYDGCMTPLCLACGANLEVREHKSDCITHRIAALNPDKGAEDGERKGGAG